MNSNTKSILPRETIERIVRANFGEDVVVDTIAINPEGWFNAVYILSFAGNGAGGHKDLVLKAGVESGKYVLSYEKDLMKTEVFVYDLLRDTIIPTPRIVVRDFSRTLVDCDYFFMEKLQGAHWMALEERISPENQDSLLAEIARYTASLHKIKGGYFGYIKDDVSYQFPTWRAGFQGMLNMQIRDGRKDGVNLPYDDILEAYEPLWDLLDEVTEPCLVNFDMWKKNIMLIEKDGRYTIDGIIDHERAFYGDPYADFISVNTICGDVSQSETFQMNYSQISGKPFTFTRNDGLRMLMYRIYLSLLIGVEVYRYNEEDTKQMLAHSTQGITTNLAKLKEAQRA